MPLGSHKGLAGRKVWKVMRVIVMANKNDGGKECSDFVKNAHHI
jgi:hypothetical protein